MTNLSKLSREDINSKGVSDKFSEAIRTINSVYEAINRGQGYDFNQFILGKMIEEPIYRIKRARESMSDIIAIQRDRHQRGEDLNNNDAGDRIVKLENQVESLEYLRDLTIRIYEETFSKPFIPYGTKDKLAVSKSKLTYDATFWNKRFTKTVKETPEV